MRYTTVFLIICMVVSSTGVTVEGVQSYRRVDLKVAAVVVAYEEVSSVRQFVETARTQLLLLRVNRVIKGGESSRYIAVRYQFGGYDQPLKSHDLEKLRQRRFSLTRDRDCDTALSDFVYIKQVTTTGEEAGRVLRLRLLTKDVSALPENMTVPCYNLFPAHSNHAHNRR